MRLICALAVLALMVGCEEHKLTSDDIQRNLQENLLKEATSQTGMPAIKNFRERKILKDILEMRDQDGLTTYTYVFNELNSKLVYLGESVGFGIPYAMQYTNPSKIERYGQVGSSSYTYQVLPQADPNGLFSPASAEGTWVLLKDPNGSTVKPVYIEPRIIVSPFKLKTD